MEMVGDCLADGTLIPFQILVEEHGLPAGQFLTYEALTRTFQILWEKGVEEPPQHRVLQMVLTMGEWGHPVKWLYGALNEAVRVPLERIKTKWEEILGEEISDKEWGKILAYPQKISRITRLKYIQLNYLHQKYLTPEWITAIYGGEVKKCPRCTRTEADFVHMVWSCPLAQEYWNAVLEKIKSTLERDLPCTVRVCILYMYTGNIQKT